MQHLKLEQDPTDAATDVSSSQERSLQDWETIELSEVSTS